MKRILELTLILALISFALIPNAVSCDGGLVPSPAQAAGTTPQVTPTETTAPPTTAPVTSETPPATSAPAPTAAAAPVTGETPTTAPVTEPVATATPEPPKEPTVMTELGVELVSITPRIRADEAVEITIRTVPGVTVFLQPVNPETGTRSAWPKEADGGKIRVADEKGLASWSWTIYKMMIAGEGTLEFLVTTSTDADYIKGWKSTMTRRAMDGFAERDDTIIVEIPFTVRP